MLPPDPPNAPAPYLANFHPTSHATGQNPLTLTALTRHASPQFPNETSPQKSRMRGTQQPLCRKVPTAEDWGVYACSTMRRSRTTYGFNRPRGGDPFSHGWLSREAYYLQTYRSKALYIHPSSGSFGGLKSSARGYPTASFLQNRSSECCSVRHPPRLTRTIQSFRILPWEMKRTRPQHRRDNAAVLDPALAWIRLSWSWWRIPRFFVYIL